MDNDVDSSQNILDIRDIIARCEELEDERQELTDAVMHADDAHAGETAQDVVDAKTALAEWVELNGDELISLGSLLADLKGCGGDHEWRGSWYPVTLIRDSFWTESVREFAEDIHGKALRDAQWPMNCIDWQQAADELQGDYASVEYDGVTYWYR